MKYMFDNSVTLKEALEKLQKGKPIKRILRNSEIVIIEQ